MKRNNFFVVALLLLAPASRCPAQEGTTAPELRSSSATMPSPVSAPEERRDTRELASAISGLNYKMELIQNRLLQAGRSIETLEDADRDLRKMLTDQRRISPGQEQVKSIETELRLLRGEIGQIREDIAMLKKSPSGEKRPGPPENDRLRQIIRWPWLGVTSLGVALLALIVAL